MDWNEASRHFLPLPWSSFDNLLVKVLSDSSGRLSLMATDLEAVYFESLTPRQLNRRVEDAMGTLAGTSQGQSQSQGVMVGIGEEGERLLKESVDALVAAVGDGSARVEISHEAFEHIVSISLPNSFTFRFLTTSLSHQSSPALASHLVHPLLGLCSSLLALLRDASTDDAELLQRLERAVDGSGTAERIERGRAGKRFGSVGGPGLLRRWVQRSLGVRDRDLRAFTSCPPFASRLLACRVRASDTHSRRRRNRAEPITLSLPTRSTPSRPFSPSAPAPAPAPPTPRKRSLPRSRSRSRSRSPSPAKPPPPSFATRMLDHRAAEQRGERVGWDESQTHSREATQTQLQSRAGSPVPAFAAQPRSRAPSDNDGDGGGAEVALGRGRGPGTDEGEPSTDDEDAPAPAAAPAVSFPPRPSPTPASSARPPAASATAPAGAEEHAEPDAAAQKRAAAQAEKERERERRRERLRQLERERGGEGGEKQKKKKARKML
ncbi:hypothetical protein DMC30DRAFT_112458 [Rhodotorula diobovata]|uniref:Uncharacterized protein n=1 Tax=Rhodotorula diobovata TaxID=5288 RepID=A0A5C5G6J3_9BASI|nr:hypothetical protein DMC30DRAFT_112458 [Rhodotorula diobovata]